MLAPRARLPAGAFMKLPCKFLGGLASWALERKFSIHLARAHIGAQEAISTYGIKTIWPSGLRRWLKAPVRKGVGSSSTAVAFSRLLGDTWRDCYLIFQKIWSLQLCSRGQLVVFFCPTQNLDKVKTWIGQHKLDFNIILLNVWKEFLKTPAGCFR